MIDKRSLVVDLSGQRVDLNLIAIERLFAAA